MNTTIQSTDFALIMQGLPQPYLVLDSGLMIVGASEAYLEATQRTRDDIVGRHILEAFPENPEAAGTVEQGPLEVSLRHVLKTGKTHEMAAIQYDIPQPGGGFTQKFWTPVHTPVVGPSGNVEYIIQNPMDVTESVLKARETDARLRVALHAANLATWEYEPETDILRRSPAVDVMFGFAPGEAGPVAVPFIARIHADDLPRVRAHLDSLQDVPDLTTIAFNFRIVLPSGGIQHLVSRGEVLRTSSGKVRMLGVLLDVTADRAREAALEEALSAQAGLIKQKDVLLAEVNHRVKNSLQLVLSTLRLQTRELDSPAAATAFNRAVARVRAIISVHERLYRKDNSLAVDMKAQLDKLCHDCSAPKDRLTVHVDPLELRTECAIPISVIVSELMMTGQDEMDGSSRDISVSLTNQGRGVVELALASSTGTAGLSRLGERIVKAMVAQLDGTYTHEPHGDGYRATVSFSPEVR
jgi:two-component sensor histidine kinase/PAS domain-containing protein